ncbi:MAG: HEAT repeat domain-containing protein [Methanolinea sp.]|jgi:HEAT repeat protein|nr:HEAT repeat domain-containing protein [Methanolinea sp.]
MTGHLLGLAEKTRPDIIQSIIDLGKKGQPAVDFLLLALKDEDKRVRIAAAHVLGEIGDRRSVEPLISMLADHDRDIRFISASALGRIGDPRAVEPLARACADENCFVRITAKEALTSLSINR